jgi:hypothetical protein
MPQSFKNNASVSSLLFFQLDQMNLYRVHAGRTVARQGCFRGLAGRNGLLLLFIFNGIRFQFLLQDSKIRRNSSDHPNKSIFFMKIGLMLAEIKCRLRAGGYLNQSGKISGDEPMGG